MPTNVPRKLLSLLVAIACLVTGSRANAADASTIRHSYLVLGGKTAIIGEDGRVEWEYRGSSRDGFVLPNGNVLIAFGDRVEEVMPVVGTKTNQILFTYRCSRENGEISTAQRLYTRTRAAPNVLPVATP